MSSPSYWPAEPGSSESSRERFINLQCHAYCIVYCIAGKFGGLAVYITTTKIEYNICMAIWYRTAKFKSANILAIAILGSTAKFNISGNTVVCIIEDHYPSHRRPLPSPHTTPGLLGDPERSSNESPAGTSPMENVSASVSSSPWVSLLPLPLPR